MDHVSLHKGGGGGTVEKKKSDLRSRVKLSLRSGLNYPSTGERQNNSEDLRRWGGKWEKF